MLIKRGIPDLIIRGAVTAFVIQALGAGLAYGLQIALARWMGVIEFGNYVYAYNWAQLLAVFGAFGVTLSILKFLPTYVDQQKWGYVKGLLISFRATSVVVSLTLALIFAVLFIFFQQESIDTGALTIGLLLTPLIALKDLQSEAIRGLNRIALAYFPPYILQPVIVISAALLIWMGEGSISALQGIGALALSLLFVLLFQYIVLNRALEKTRGVKPEYEINVWSRVSGSMLVIQGASAAWVRIDVVVVGWLLGAADVGAYSVAVRTAFLITFVSTAVNAVVAPMIGPLFEKGDRAGLQRMTVVAIRISSAAALGIGIFIGLFSTQLLAIFGKEFVVATPALGVLAVGYMLSTAGGPLGYLLHLTGHQKVSATLYSGAALVSLILNLILVSRIGILGAAVATSIVLAGQNVLMYLLVRQLVGIDALGLPLKAAQSP
jgi:O-antigen/teichoic acid export membrane protein